MSLCRAIISITSRWERPAKPTRQPLISSYLHYLRGGSARKTPGLSGTKVAQAETVGAVMQ